MAGDAFTLEGFHEIIQLMGHFIEGRHEWMVDIRDVGAIEGYFQSHVPKMAKTYELMARKAMVSATWSGPAAVVITRDSLSDHTHDLARPAKVVVENQESDRCFVVAVAHILGDRRLLDAHRMGWLEFSQGGGSGELAKIVRAERGRFRRLFRVTFVLDSDRLTPDGASKHEGKIATLIKEGVPGHLLQFREAENYLPTKVLAASSGAPSEKSKKLGHLKRLTPDQRAHLDVKKAFWNGKEKRFAVLPEQVDLYDSLEPKVIEGLGQGFGEGLCALFERLAEAGALTEADLGPEATADLRLMLELLQTII
ncbi:hypothetical protein [Herbidospora daliensis]|uniref:hypothetical protein n=1 Tax=Herbidospora daliensis TaxID=295585 RepID=UPI0007810D68|nr:hypothetical protein [Herbidospora daliensis]